MRDILGKKVSVYILRNDRDFTEEVSHLIVIIINQSKASKDSSLEKSVKATVNVKFGYKPSTTGHLYKQCVFMFEI